MTLFFVLRINFCRSLERGGFDYCRLFVVWVFCMGRQLSSVYVVIALVSNINHVKICGGGLMSFALRVSFHPFLQAYGELYYERYKGFSHRLRFRRRARGLVRIRRRPSNTRRRAEDPGFNSPRARQRLSRNWLRKYAMLMEKRTCSII